MIKAVIIDLDDTLCLTEAACFEMENAVLKSMARSQMSRDIHLNTWGKALAEAMPLRSPGIDFEAFMHAYRPIIAAYTETGKLDAIPEANYAAMDQLIKLDKTIFLLTSRSHVEVKHLLKPDHPLANRVKAFYYRDNMQYHKPDPRAFGDLLKHTLLQPSRCVYIGDSVTDAQAAKAAGLHFVASLESGLRQKQDFDGLSVDAFIKKFPDIVTALASLEDSGDE